MGAGRITAGTPNRRTTASQSDEAAEAENERRQSAVETRPHAGKRHALEGDAADDVDERDQRARQRRGDEQRRPDLHRLAVIGAGEQAGAEAAVLALRHLGDDGADERRRGADLHAGEEERQARRRAQLAHDLRGRRRIGAQEIELQRLGRAQALDHADGDREEAEIGGDHRLRRDAADVELVEDDDDHRRQRDDRHRLRGDDPRHQRAFEQGLRDDQHRQRRRRAARRWRSRSASPPA